MSELAERLKNMTPLQRAVFALQETQARLQALEQRHSEPIAIVGMACRFPGKVIDAASFWRLLCEGVDAIEVVPPDRWNIDDLYDPDPAAPGKMNSRWGGFLENIDQFDNRFFGISDGEAMQIDPQQRILLELAWEALEDAGLPPVKLRSTKVGVFVAISNSEYASKLTGDLSQTSAYAAVGTSLCLAANRVSFVLGLQGPSVALETACSSALVATHLACQSIRNGDCEGALVGGVNLLLSPIGSINLTKAGFCAGDGRIRAFDAAASGYVRSEGAGMVMLKPISAALKNGDNIYAVIRGSAVNQNGSSNGLTAPSRAAQEQVLREAYARAKVSPGLVGFVESQGTGTRLGDVIEATALGNVLRQDRAAGSRCFLGAVKTNIGHMETASGMASLMKASLALQRQQVPPNVNFENPNPDIPFDALALSIPRRLESWPETAQPRFAGVSAFGFGGSNAHIVLEEPPATMAEPPPAGPDAGRKLLLLSARTDSALRELTRGYVRFLGDNPPAWADVCYTAAERREHHDCRLAVLADSHQQAAKLLEDFLNGRPRATVLSGRKPYGRGLKVAFLYGDRAEEWQRCAAGMAELTPGFAVATEEIDGACRRVAGFSLATLFAEQARWQDPQWAGSRVIALQLALSAWWRRAGISPDVVLGQGAGELTAAAVAGILTPEEALQLAVENHAGNGCRTHAVAPPRQATLPFLSTVDGKRHPGSDLDTNHWRQCLLGQTRLSTAAAALVDRQVDFLLEVGPAWLAEDDRRILAHGRPSSTVVPALLPTGAGVDVLSAIAALYVAGADLHWDRLASARGQCVPVPTYPWQRQRLWAPRENGWVKTAPAPAIEINAPVQAPAVSPNTTVDRRRRPELNAPYVAPRSELETRLVQAWSEILKVDGLGIHDNFFELGGHSLLATQLLLRLNREFTLDIPLRELFDAVTIEKLGQKIVAAQQAGTQNSLPPIQPAARERLLPITYNQEPFWVSSYLQQGPAPYAFHSVMRIKGPLDVEAMEEALNEIVRRHEPLRTTFAEQGDDLVQQIAPYRPWKLKVVDLSQLSTETREEELRRYAKAESERPIDLATGPLLRLELLKMDEDEHAVLVGKHHIMYDGWSLEVLTRELVTAYFAFAFGHSSPLPELPIQYADFAVWQRDRLQGDVLDGLRAYWLTQLQGLPILKLPTDRPRPPVRTTHGAVCERPLPGPLGQAIRQLGKQAESTTFMTLLAAFQVLLHRYSGQEDFAVNTPVAGRLRPETENLIGCFINDLVLRADLAGDPSFRQLLARARETVLDAFDHQEMPFMRLIRELNPPRDPSRRTLVQTELILHNVPPASAPLPGLELSDVRSLTSTEGADFELCLEVFEEEHDFQLRLVYQSDLFEEATIEHMLEHFQAVLEAATANPDQRLSRLSLPDVPRSSLGDQSHAASRLNSQPVNTIPAYLAPRSDTERKLAAIWTRLLRLEQVGVNDDFFENGGYSLLAVRMMAQARAALGAEMPAAVFFAAPTIAALARHFETARQPRQPETNRPAHPAPVIHQNGVKPRSPATTGVRSLVTLRSGGRGLPLFCIHGVGGHVISFGALARSLTDSRPVYGLQGRGVEPGERPHNRIEDMAAAYLNEIVETQPSGPYLLAGWSMGGLIALEAARRLTATGEEVALVAMFDTGFAVGDRTAGAMDDQSVLDSIARRLDISATELKRMPLDAQWERIAARAKLVEGNGVAEIRCLADVCLAHIAALADHSPGRYDGPVVLFHVGPDGGLNQRWRKLCPDLRVERVPGNHYTLLRPPHVNVLAERLGQYLAATVGADEMARAR